MTLPTDYQNNPVYWKNRRRMAWSAFVSAVGLVFVLTIGAILGSIGKDVIQALSVPVGGLLTWSGAIVMNYITAATYQEVKIGDSTSKSESR